MRTGGSPVMSSTAREAILDVQRIREDFPILKQTVHGRPLVYLDNAATSQKPQAVIDAELRFYLQGLFPTCTAAFTSLVNGPQMPSRTPGARSRSS